jgi:hypothetical protein
MQSLLRTSTRHDTSCRSFSPDRSILSYRFLLNDFKSFNSLFKVLFIFPSQYLFAIGFPSIFSFRRSLPPILGCSPKQPDSSKASIVRSDSIHGVFTLFDLPFQGSYASSLLLAASSLYNSGSFRSQISILSSCLFARRYWGNLC